MYQSLFTVDVLSIVMVLAVPVDLAGVGLVVIIEELHRQGLAHFNILWKQ